MMELIALAIILGFLVIGTSYLTAVGAVRTGKYSKRVVFIENRKITVGRIVYMYPDGGNNDILVLAPTGKYHSVTVGKVFPIDLL